MILIICRKQQYVYETMLNINLEVDIFLCCYNCSFFKTIAFCPDKESAMGIIVVSLPCTAYLCGALIALCELPC